MENNLQNKAKFFAQHFDSEAIWRTSELDENVDEVTWEFKNFKYINETDYLELKPISLITDEDAQSIAKIENDYVDPVVRGKNLANWIFRDISSDFHCVNMRFKILLQIIDFLRSKGYALPWMGLSVEKQLEYGWIKLKND